LGDILCQPLTTTRIHGPQIPLRLRVTLLCRFLKPHQCLPEIRFNAPSTQITAANRSLGCRIPLFCRETPPLERLDNILGDPLATGEMLPTQKLRFGRSQHGCTLITCGDQMLERTIHQVPQCHQGRHIGPRTGPGIPGQALEEVLRNTLTGRIKTPKGKLCLWMTLVGGLAVPIHGACLQALFQ
jgi:hypothetical protein